VACEGRASGVSCRVRRPIWQPIGYPAAPTHPPHAIGTRAPLGDQTTSIEASFDFSVQRSLKYPHVRPQMGNFATASRRESDPIPPPRSRGVQREPLGPLSQNRRRTSGWELESQIWGPRPMRTPGPKFRLMCRTRAGGPLTPPGPRRPHPCDRVTVLELVGGAPAQGWGETPRVADSSAGVRRFFHNSVPPSRG